MFDQVKIILENEYKNKINQYDILNEQAKEYERQFEMDKTEDEYKEALKKLNKEYSIFKRNKEYKEKLVNIQKDYYEKLKNFKEEYDKYIDLKKEMLSLNIIYVKKQMDKLDKATSLADLRMSEKEAEDLIQGNNQ